MTRCRCKDITNAKSDERNLANIRQFIREAWADSCYTASGELGKLGKKITEGATPANSTVFGAIKDKLEKPVFDKLLLLRDKCDNKLAALPREIQNLKREDTSYHDMIAANFRHYNPG